ncbi:MAG: hypothetical protein ACXACY_18995 [Candidatus Hodarchaeales archaeon]|jgi:hypothetical protein
MENQKLEQEELQTVQNMLTAFEQLKSKIGDTEISKAKLLNQVGDLQGQYSQYEKILVEKYGTDVKIDVETGNITKVEPVAEKV